MTRVIRRTGPDFPAKYVNGVFCEEARDFMRRLPDKCVDVIITDPPWPDVDPRIDFPNAQNAWAVWEWAGPEFARLTDRLVVIIGCHSDPRILATIPRSLPFLRLVKLQRVPPAYRGPLLIDSDIAYVFGHTGLNGVNKTMGGWSDANLEHGHGGHVCARLQDDPPDPIHPTKRHIKHMRYLVYTFSQRGEMIFDPFCGSGQTLRAAKELGRRWCGVDLVLKYVQRSRQQLHQTKVTIKSPELGSIALVRQSRKKANE